MGSQSPFEPVERRIADAIAPGERVVWTSSAPKGVLFRSSDWGAVPFSLFFCAFAVFWESAVVFSRRAPIFMVVWGIPFVLVGLYMLVGRFFIDAWLRARTFYAVTDRAAYVIRFAPFAVVRRYAGSALDSAQLEPGTAGFGTIRFAASVPMWLWSYGGSGLFRANTVDAFYNIADARDVYTMVIRAADRSAREPTTA